MKYRVYYTDYLGRGEQIIEAPDHRSAAKQFYDAQPRVEHCRITVEAKSLVHCSVEQFDASEFMSEETRLSIPPAAKTPKAPVTPSRSYPAIRSLASVYRVIAWLFLVAGVILCIVLASTSGSLLVFIAAAFAVALGFLVQLASAELLAILPDIADSVKQSSNLLRELRDQSAVRSNQPLQPTAGRRTENLKDDL